MRSCKWSISTTGQGESLSEDIPLIVFPDYRFEESGGFFFGKSWGNLEWTVFHVIGGG